MELNKNFKNQIKLAILEVLNDKELELDEITATGNIDGYMTPNFLSGKKGKKRKKVFSTISTGYELVNEELEKRDIKLIRLIIRDTIADVLYRIWVKRNAWKNVG